jgi:hypothetical protein
MKVLKIKEIPTPKIGHPDPPNSVLSKHEFSMGIIAPKGSGKTTLICNLLMFYKKYFNDIFIFSPTVLSDDKWDFIKKQELLLENKPLKKWLQQEKKKREGTFQHQIVQDPPANIGYEENTNISGNEFDGRIPEENFYHNYSEEDLEEILMRQKRIINGLKKAKKPKYLADRILLIFDDLVGSALFGMAKDNLFKGFNTRHRHYSTSIIMVSQGYKEIPKTIRTNWSCLILFEIANMKELTVIYEEFTMGLSFKDWLEMYNHAVEPEYAFLYLNLFAKKGLRCMQNFDKYLFHN